MKKAVLSTAVAATLFSGAVLAQPYVGASAGQSDYKIDTAGVPSADTNDTGFKFFGGYMFSPNFGVEGSLFDLGKARGSVNVGGVGNVSAEAEVRGVAAYGIAVLPIEDFSLFAKAGVAYARAKLNAITPVSGIGDSESSFQPAYGLGAGYAINRNVGLRAEWERVRVEYSGGAKEDADLLSVGVTYRF